MNRCALAAVTLAVGALLGCDQVLDGGYSAHLLLQSMSPEEASTSGGTVLTLRGARFCEDLTVRIGDQEPTFQRVDSSRQAVVTVPEHGPGEVLVSIACLGEQAVYAKPLRYVPDIVTLVLGDDTLDHAAYGDANADGIFDAWVKSGSTTQPVYSLHLGRGRTGEFDAAPTASISTEYSDPPPQMASIRQPRLFLGDFTGDGTLDALLLGDVYVMGRGCVVQGHLFAGEAAFAEIGSFEVEGMGEQMTWVERIADLDGDGWLDLIVADWDYYSDSSLCTVAVKHGTGPGAFDPPIPLFAEAWWTGVEYFEQRLINPLNGGPGQVDFNADSITDLVFSSSPFTPFLSGSEWIFVNGDRARNYVVKRVSLPPGRALAYFDGDGLLDMVGIDLATAASPMRVVHIWPGTGVGEFSTTSIDFTVSCLQGVCPEVTTPDISAALWPLRFDVDADGAGEFVMLNARGAATTDGSSPNIIQAVWLELGANPITADVLLLGAFPANHVGALDDLYQPLLRSVIPGPNATVRVATDVGVTYVAPGASPGFLVAHPLPSFGASGSELPCVGDFTGDGILDVLAIDNAPRLFAGTGSGWLEPVPVDLPSISASSCTPLRLHAGGKLDFFTPNAVYRNSGGGRFVQTALTIEGRSALSLTFLAHPDVDGDGADELVAHALVPVDSAGNTAPKIWLLAMRADGTLGVTMSGDLPAGLLYSVVVNGVRAIETSLDLAKSGVFADLNDDHVLDLAQRSPDWGLWVFAGGVSASAVPDVLSFTMVNSVAGSGFRWVSLLGDAGDRTLVTSSGIVARSQDDRYVKTSQLPLPQGMQLEKNQVALCNLKGRGRFDLVLVASGLFGYTSEQPGLVRGVFGPIAWTDLGTLGLTELQLVGCLDTDGDGLDDIVTQDVASSQLFLLRNGSR